MSIRGFRGSFLGFTFNGKHSSTMGITRVYNDWLDIALTPNLLDTTVDVATADGVLFSNTAYDKKNISISFAFDGVSEAGLQALKQWLGTKQICDLVLDEEPYKVWSAKVSGYASIKHLCFEVDGQRFYKGEGEVTFICPCPYARSRFEYKEEFNIYNIREWSPNGAEYYVDGEDFKYDQDNYALIEYTATKENPNHKDQILMKVDNLLRCFPGAVYEKSNLQIGDSSAELLPLESDSPYINIKEWKDAFELPSQSEYGYFYIDENTGKHVCIIYNAGDQPIPLKMYFKYTSTAGIFITVGHIVETKISLKIPSMKNDNNKYLCIDTRDWLVYGCDENYKPTGAIYNEYLNIDNFFDLELGSNILYFNTKPTGIEFHYLYS